MKARTTQQIYKEILANRRPRIAYTVYPTGNVPGDFQSWRNYIINEASRSQLNLHEQIVRIFTLPVKWVEHYGLVRFRGINIPSTGVLNLGIALRYCRKQPPMNFILQRLFNWFE